jgi:ubiquinone/menaquinone biosynthesis C-methylase UbiE
MKVEDRFTNRVENYIKYRPHYPDAVYTYLYENNFVAPQAVIADIGCGTGISSELFLKHDHKVLGVEPNKNMLDSAIIYLDRYNGFIPVPASAEHTGLLEASADLVVCAQAFHWFDKEKAKAEFKRILKPGGKVLLLWNDRKTESTDFLKVYEDFLQMFGTDYKNVNHKNVQNKSVFESFFGGDFTEMSFENSQSLDFNGLKGRVLSSSYMPNESHPDYEFMLYCLKKIFQRFQGNEKVTIDYDTKLYIGNLN